MIKELWHWMWMFLSHLLTFRWSGLSYHWKNLWMYLIYGFTLYDLGDMDSYLVKRIGTMLVLFEKQAIGYPYGMSEEQWHMKLLELAKQSEYLLSPEFYDLHPRKQEALRRHYLMELRRYFFHLWF